MSIKIVKFTEPDDDMERLGPRIFCDACDRMIENHKAGVFLFDDKKPELILFACHEGVTKRPCHRVLEKKFAMRSWHHLDRFILYLGNSLHFNWKKQPQKILEMSI